VPESSGSAPARKRKVTIVVPETYKKVSDEVWQELETFLYMGFLTATSVIHDQAFVFKTTNQLELRLVNHMRSTSPSKLDVKNFFRSQFIAYSIFMINGRNALFERPRHIDRLINTISRLPVVVQDKIIENLAALNERAARLYPLVEVYAYENRSRFKWMHTRLSPVHTALNTGIPGTDEIGMNLCQQTWVALNHIIDRREDMERDWSHAKFIGSCFAGKGIRSIDERDRSRLDKERVEREELKMKVLWKYLNRTSYGDDGPEDLIVLPGGRKASVVKKFKAETAEELAAEMSAAASGEKDYHDLVIEQKQKEMRERAIVMNRERMQMYASPKLLPGSQSSTGSRILGGKQEADAYLKRMAELREEQLARSRRPIEPDADTSEASDEE
jgi:hypothetical protein